MNSSLDGLIKCMRQLGHATSCNLEFSYRTDVPISYGEETITESNLLELRRHHSDIVHLRTLSKHEEASIGADWEWYIVGRRRTLRMRVQAKRVQRTGVLKIRHVVGQSGGQQRDLLIQAARVARMRPMYCIYCTESHRNLWKQTGRWQTGCLLVDARVMPLSTRRLDSIEWACWPWHYLLDPFPATFSIDHFLPREEGEEIVYEFPFRSPLRWDGPTILDLNEDTGRTYNLAGVGETTSSDLAMVDSDSFKDVVKESMYDDLSEFYNINQRTVAIDVRPFFLEE